MTTKQTGGSTVTTVHDAIVITADITANGVSTPIVVRTPQEYNVYGHGAFDGATVAVEWSLSDFGSQWVAQTSGIGGINLLGGIFADNLYVVSGNLGTILTSPDTVTWTTRTTATNDALLGLAFNGLIFVAVGIGGRVMTSPDAITAWVQRVSNTAQGLHEVVLAPWLGLFVACGNMGTIIVSADGVGWGVQSTPVSDNLVSIAVGKDAGNNDLLVAVGTGGAIVTSPDAVTWTQQTSPLSSSLSHVIYTGTLFFVVSATGGLNVMTSLDGVAWAVAGEGVPGISLFTAAFVFNTYIVAGAAGKLFTSPDAVKWTEQDSGTGQSIQDIFEGLGIIVLVANAGIIQTSSGEWTPLKDADGTTVSFTAQAVFNIPRIGAGVQMRTNTSAAGASTNVSVDLR